MKFNTRVVHGNSMYEERTGAISTPIYQSATFRHEKLYKTTGYDYSRLLNPTREELEKTIANLEKGKFGFAFSSGMAAISVIFSLFNPGDHIILSDDMYGGTYRMIEQMYRKYKIEFDYIDTSNLDFVKKAVKDNTKGIFIETPTNPMMKLTDISSVSDIAKESNALFIVDNTFLTPYLQNPIELGADIVVHSGTKFLGGHNDTLAGLIIVKDDKLAEDIFLIQKTEGSVLSPFDSWLILRGIKTLSLRLERQQSNAEKIVEWMKKNDNICKIYYPSLNENINDNILKQSKGFGSMISFRVKNKKVVENVLERIKLILFAESLGGVESLITYPVVQTHSAIPEEIRNKLGVDETLLRLSVGIEDVNDLIDDLDNALK